MGFKDILKDLASSIFSGSVVEDVKHTVKQTMDDIEKKTLRIVHNTIRSLVVMIMVSIGAIFALVGLSKYLSETVVSLNNGLGFVVVGAALIILATFAKLMQKE